jgi:intermediate peptidase
MARNRPNAKRALLKLSRRKQGHLNTKPNPVIQPWDRDYYCPPEPPAPPIPLPRLTLGTVFMGLSRLFKHLYGVTLRPANVVPGQVWHPDVRKLEVVDEDNEILGFIYADLFDRRGKPGGAAHYTVSCSRRVDDDDESGDYTSAEAWNDPRLAFSREFGSIHRMRRRGREGVYQIPVVALLCDFTPRSGAVGPKTLEWYQVLTLAHEMGHAMHCELV